MHEVPDLATAHAQIRDLLARIAASSDLGTVEDYLAHFSPDATWEMGVTTGLPMEAATLPGIAAIRASVEQRRLAGIQGPGSHTAHQVSTTHITLDADTATAESLFLYFTHTAGTPTLAAIGRYTDTVTWAGGRWLLQHRLVTRN